MTTFQTIKKFFSPILVHPRDYFWNSFGALLLCGFTIFTIEITRKVIIAIQGNNEELLHSLLITYAVVTILFSISRFLLYKTGWSNIMHNGVDIYLKKYMSKYIQAEGNTIEKIGTGRFLTILDKGLHDWFDMLYSISFVGVTNILFTLYAIYTIFTISLLAGWTSIGVFAVSGIVATYANIWMTKKRHLRRDAYKEAIHNTTIMIMSRNEILQNKALFSDFTRKISRFLQTAKYAHHPVNFGYLVIEEFPRFMLLTIRIGLYVFIANTLWKGESSFADFAIFITIMALAERALNEFLHLTRDCLRMFSYVGLLWETFDNLTPIQGYERGATFHPNTRKDIVLKNLKFGYDKNMLFENLSLTIPYGKKTALVGASGGGKTTLMKLIAGYLHPDSGSISVMGNILSDTALKTYYPHIGYLTQDPSVFDATIRENLISAISDTFPSNGQAKDDLQKKGHEEYLEEKLKETLKLAHCDFVFELEKGLDTEIGERGVRLSGGQKQRLAIAKIFLKNPEIILLDEPTSALDSFSEEHITKALDELFKGRTVVIVAHRLQTVKKADDIIVLDGGKVVERGDHGELVEKGGIYNRMLELQSGF